MEEINTKVEADLDEAQDEGDIEWWFKGAKDILPLFLNPIFEPFILSPLKGEFQPVLQGNSGIQNILVAQVLLNSIFLPVDL